MERAVQEIQETAMMVDDLPTDNEIRQELESEPDVSKLSSEAIWALVESALLNQLLQPETDSGIVSWEWQISDDRRTDLAELEPSLFATIKQCAIATIEEKRKQKPNPITAGTSQGRRITRRGRPANFLAYDFAGICYAGFLDATGQKPSRRTDAYAGGDEYGPFRDFVEACAEHWHIDGSVDWMVRHAVSWIQDDSGQPNKHELRFIRSLGN